MTGIGSPGETAAFRDPALARALVARIAGICEGIDREVNLMEVCGTHTMAIAKSGIRSVLPPNVHLISGPGCPVCVTPNAQIDAIIALAKMPGVKLATFGDMVRVPGSSTSLQRLRALGADMEVVYSPLDALEAARANPGTEVVFAGVGFETTIPSVAATVKRARKAGVRNFSVYCAHKNVPHVLEALVNDPEVTIDAFILPGHVSTIIGSAPYGFLARDHGIPGVVTGFEALDILQGIAMLLGQLREGRAEIEIAYTRGVRPEGNLTAMALVDEVFEECDAPWRGLGTIPLSGYRFRGEYAAFDAATRFADELAVTVEPTVEPAGCRCADVLRGVIAPSGCALFGRACTPDNPVGPCMVSSEGSCAAYHRYREF